MNPSKPTEFSTKSLQLAIFLHASESLPYLRTEADRGASGKVNFIFRDDAGRGSQLQLEYNRGAAVPARNLFASQTFLRQQMTGITENLNNGESSNDRLKTRTAIGLMSFAGLRPGEARGARWEAFDGKRLTLRRSTWRTHTTTTKTDSLGEEPRQVPVIEPLALLLAELRSADGDPSFGPILRGPSGKSLNLDNLVRRVLSPLLKAANIPWHGWYSLRRGVATTLVSLTGNLMASKGLLRHASTKTTERFYVEDVPKNTLEGMNRLAALFSDCSTTKQ
jgi:integrase